MKFILANWLYHISRKNNDDFPALEGFWSKDKDQWKQWWKMAEIQQTVKDKGHSSSPLVLLSLITTFDQ